MGHSDSRRDDEAKGRISFSEALHSGLIAGPPVIRIKGCDIAVLRAMTEESLRHVVTFGAR